MPVAARRTPGGRVPSFAGFRQLVFLGTLCCATVARAGGDAARHSGPELPETSGTVLAAPTASRSPRTPTSLDADTRRSILDAMRVGRATEDGRGVRFTNPEQQLTATIETAGTTITGLGGVRVAFSHASVGRRPPDGRQGRLELQPADAGPVEGVGTTRVTIARPAGHVAVTEWWANSPAGIEQGFTIDTRPGGDGPLTIEQTVTTRLMLRVSEDAASVAWSEAGRERLRFEHLRAWDDTGRALPAHLEARGDRLAMVVDDSDARYPVTVDPTWTQQAYLKASNTGVGDQFGTAIAVSGDTAVVGAPGEASSATGVNGNEANDSTAGAGAAYVFVRSGTTWTQQAYLKASNTEASDLFGWAVAVSGDTVVVSAVNEDSAATGVNGNESLDAAADYNAGAAYVFVRTGTTWTQQAYLKASNTGAGDQFGHAVDVSGDTVVVGAYSESSDAAGVNGDETNDNAPGAGAAYVFVRTGATWTQQAYLKASNTETGDAFGRSVAVSGDTVVVGARGEASNATGVNGNETDNNATESGAAYVFVRAGTSWTQQAYLKASNTEASDRFGHAVALSGDTVVVGAFGEDSNATGVNGSESNGTGDTDESGAAYVFVRAGTVWTQQAYLKASNTGVGDQFGLDVGASGDTVVVGAVYEASNATGVNGDELDNNAGLAGAAYVFVRSGTSWTQQAYLKASNTNGGDRFGHAVAISGDTVVAGALGEDSGATGVNGDQASNSALFAGAAYVFRRNAVTNGTFSNGATGWLQYATPDISYIVSSVTSGPNPVFEYYRVPPPPGTSNQAVAFQQTGMPLATGSPIAATFDLGNSSTVRKRIAVLLHDSTFQDLSVCTFWLPPGSPLQTYEMRTHTTQAWGDATISFYAATPGSDGGAYRLDNVMLTYEPTQSATRTDCVDPLAPTPPGGADSANLLANGDFSGGFDGGTGYPLNWLLYGTITWQIATTGNVFEFIRPDATPPAGVVFQPSGSTTTADEILTATFELGNSSSVRKRVTVLLHDVDFSDLTACTWYLPPGAPLAKYEMRTYVSESGGWGDATLSVYAATTGTDPWIRLDNATLQRTPSGAALGTECFEPGDPGAPLLVAGGGTSPVTRTTSASFSTAFGSGQPASGPETATTWQAVAGSDGWQTFDWSRTIDLRRASVASLSFESWLSSRHSRAEIQVSLDGVTWQTAGEVPASEDWLPLALDLGGFAGHVIQVRFVFEAGAPTPGDAPDRWLVRDVIVSTGPGGR